MPTERRGTAKKEKEANILRRKIFCADEKKDRKGKGGNYLEKEKKFLRRKKTEKEKQENFSCGGVKKIEKEKEENICKRKIIFALESHNREGNGGKISWRRKYCCGRVDGRTSKALKEVLGHLKSA